jgi:hypothetical protein
MDTPDFSYSDSNEFYRKMYGINRTKDIIDKSQIEEQQNINLSMYDELLSKSIDTHNQYVIPELEISSDSTSTQKIMIEKNIHIKPINIESFIELDRNSKEFKNNICLIKFEFKLMLILLKHLNSDNIAKRWLFFQSPQILIDESKIDNDLKEAKELYKDLSLDWSKLGLIAKDGLILVTANKTNQVKTETTNINLPQLYKIIYVGYSPKTKRKEIIVIRHILFPKYYISFTALQPETLLQKTNINFSNPFSIPWWIYHASMDILGIVRQNVNVDIRCDEKIENINVHYWMWNVAQKQTIDAIQHIERDFIEWWEKNIDDSVFNLEDINKNYCQNTEDIYCNTNQNKKHTHFYNECIDKSARHCCDSEKPLVCMELFPPKVTNKLAQKIKEIGKKYYGNSFDNFESSRHGRPDISIIGNSLGGGIGTLSILVLIDYFSKKQQKIFNIEATFFTSIKSTSKKSFEIMKKYDNIIPVHIVNSKVEFMVEPTDDYYRVLEELKQNGITGKPSSSQINEYYTKIFKKNITHSTDIFNFIPGINIDILTLYNPGGNTNFDDIPFTYYYFGFENTIYKDIGIYNNKICPVYKKLLENGECDNNDISEKILKFVSIEERNKYIPSTRDILSPLYSRNMPKWKFMWELHVPSLYSTSIDSIYKNNQCDKHRYDY